MSVFDFAGASNPEDAGGGSGSPLAPPSSIPSVAAGPTEPPAVPPDPRLAAVLQSLQPKPPVPPWQAALQKIVPMLGALYAMKQNAGGAFAQSYENIDKQRTAAADQHAQEQLRLATVIHQQQQEQHAAETARLTEAKNANLAKLAAAKVEATAQTAETNRREKLMRDEWTSQSQGGLIDTINDVIKTQGPEAADRYMASTHIGALTAEGLPHTVKDLVDRYAVRAPDGTLIGGKGRTVKEAKAGTQEDWVTSAEDIEEKQRGRPLTTEERKAVDGAAIVEYKKLSKDPDVAELNIATKKMQLSLDSLRAEQLRTTINDIKDAKGDIIEGTKEFGIARDLAYGILSYGDFARMYAFQRAGREQMRKIYDKARELNPDFSPSLFEQGAKFAGATQTKRSMAAVANVESGIPSMIAASNAASRSNIKALNEHFIIPGGVQLGDKSYAELQSAHKAFGDELSLALGVGTASDLKTKLGLDIADPNLDPAAFQSVLEKQVLPFLERRKTSLKGQMGPYAAGGAQEMLPGGAKPAAAPGVTPIGRYNPATGRVEKP